MAKSLAEILASGNIAESALDRRATLANTLMASGQRATNPLIAFLTGAVGSYQLGDIAREQTQKETDLQKAAESQANAPQPLFEGTGLEAQQYNILASADPSSKAYQIAYNALAAPKVQADAQGNIVTVKPDLSAFQPPAAMGGTSAQAPTMPQVAPSMPQVDGQLPPIPTLEDMQNMPIDASEEAFNVPYGTEIGGNPEPTIIDGAQITQIPSEAGKFKSKMDAEKTLRSEFDDQTKGFKTVANSFKKIREVAENPSAAGDISLLTAYMKMLDPNSTVREGEFATAQNAAGVPEKVRAYFNGAISGQRLTPATRSDFLKQAENVYRAEESGYNNTFDRYTGLAQSYKVDPKNVISDYRVKEPKKDAKPAQELTNEELQAIINGQ